MMTLFHIFSFISIISTLLVIFQNNPIYSLFYLIISFLSISGIYFTIEENLIGSFETIVYAGAIMVLFVFAIMIFNLGKKTTDEEKKILSKNFLISGFILSFFLFVILYNLFDRILCLNNVYRNNIKNIGRLLFSEYALLVEISSMILLSSLIIVFHLCCYRKKKEF
ncbi:NADH-quinone oxidoreductase subunit J [Buchnera aphidicola]|uniref:NADH-quinone oxidoreductase subunit J n=1 Tax=Buchnera aphidicola TaxID=9 RepID=UPI0020935FCC|nr:NADH-quinone oxidoreductase subunit J [Buchnera aphidicola]USS94243.1 NADH-quinone oxidoreductase subunit J [Buchnera aphidicola (Sipha maydis)]